MSLRLRHNLHWCVCGGRAIFLDLEKGRYFCLRAAANEVFLRLAAGETKADDTDRLRTLMGQGILVEGEGDAHFPSPALIEPPVCDYLTEARPRADPLEIVRGLAAEMRTAWLLRTRPIKQVIETARAQAPKLRRISANPDSSLQGIIAVASACALLTRAHNRCLNRALVVHSACKTRGIEAKLVLGVIAHPFAAHCWVQLGSAVLVGDFERARLYTPILVVG